MEPKKMDEEKKQKWTAIVCALVSTLVDVRNMQAPEGILYAAMMGRHNVSLDDYTSVVNVMVAMGLVTRGPMHMLILTDAGVEMGNEVNRLLENK